MFSIREITPNDKQILEDFLYNAIFIPKGASPFPRDEIYKPEVFIYIDSFGEKPDDIGVVAEFDGKPAGAAWVRVIPAYGHIDDETPELAISVFREYRNQGVGTKIMTRLFGVLRERGYKQTSLAVQKENPAVSFYQRLGYEIITEAGEEYIMLKSLAEKEVSGQSA